MKTKKPFTWESKNRSIFIRVGGEIYVWHIVLGPLDMAWERKGGE